MRPTTYLKNVLVLVVALIAATFAPHAFADPSPAIPDTYPWSNVNIHFGASIRQGRVVRVRPNPTWGMSVADGGLIGRTAWSGCRLVSRSFWGRGGKLGWQRQ